MKNKNHKQRVCIITPYAPPVKGGISTNTFNLASKLRESNRVEKVKVLVQFGNQADIVEKMPESRMLFILKSFVSLLKMKPTAIHSNSTWYALFPGAFYKILYPRVRLIHTFHTEHANLSVLKRIIFGGLLSTCDTVTFVAEFLESEIEKQIDIKCRKEIIGSGISIKKVTEEEVQRFKTQYHLESAVPILTFVGPLVWEDKVEGVRRLIFAFRDVLISYPEARLIIVGDGMYRGSLENSVRDSKIQDHVIFTKSIDNVFIPLKATDIYVHITLQEGLATALLEAMSMKKPVIASNVGGIPEIIVHNETGILVEPKPEAIAKEIIELYKNKRKMKILGESAHKSVTEKYSWDNLTEKFLNIYEGNV